MTHSETLDQLATALAKAQAQVMGAKKDAANPFYKSKYADLGSVWEACREALTANGLSVVQLPGFEGGEARLTTYLLHSSGQWIAGTAGSPLVKHDPQGVGSALTYLRRYALAAVVGVVQEDDDGNDASGRTMQVPTSKMARAVERSVSKAADQAGVAYAPPLDQPPPALATKDPMPWEEVGISMHTIAPFSERGLSLSAMSRSQLMKAQLHVMQHPEIAHSEAWAALIKSAIAAKA